VKKYFLDGTFAGDFTSVPVSQSIGMDWDQSGNFYVSSYNGHYIRKFDSNGIDLGLFVDSNISGPTNIWFNSNGELLVNDYNAAAVKKFDGTGNYIGDFVPAIGSAEGVDFLPNGNILIGSGFSHSVKMYDSNGNFINDFIPSGSGNLLTPNAIVVRESVSTSVNELNAQQKSFVHPTIGRDFYFSENIDHYKKVMLYSLEGKFIKNIFSENNFWKADNIEQGFYIIRIIYRNDMVEQAKIYISK
jgi:hypothetical protein